MNEIWIIEYRVPGDDFWNISGVSPLFDGGQAEEDVKWRNETMQPLEWRAVKFVRASD
jgi:hypothetical protein